MPPKVNINNIFKAVQVGRIFKDKQPITVNVATETSKWTRPESVAKNAGHQLEELIEQNKHVIPKDTKVLTMREHDHPSEADPRSHYDFIAEGADGSKKTLHLYREHEETDGGTAGNGEGDDSKDTKEGK